jgi:hypothetical protein
MRRSTEVAKPGRARLEARRAVRTDIMRKVLSGTAARVYDVDFSMFEKSPAAV